MPVLEEDLRRLGLEAKTEPGWAKVGLGDSFPGGRECRFARSTRHLRPQSHEKNVRLIASGFPQLSSEGGSGPCLSQSVISISQCSGHEKDEDLHIFALTKPEIRIW